jgi:hypothetical protein
VNPKKIKVCPKEDNLEWPYWVLNDPNDIRPYGLCFKEVGNFPEVRGLKYVMPDSNSSLPMVDEK